MKNAKAHILKTVDVWWLGGVLAIAVVIVSLLPIPITFNIRADTQVITFQPGESHRSEWRVENAEVYIGNEPTPSKFSGDIRVLPGSDVVFTRVGKEALNISIRANQFDGAVANLRKAGAKKWEPVNERLILSIPAESLTSQDFTMSVFPMSGMVTLGADIPERIIEQPLMLLSGIVTMLSHEIIGEEKYEAGRSILEMGDKVSVTKGEDVYGVIMAGDKPDMLALCRVVASKLNVYRFGAKGYALNTSLLERIKNDPLLQIMWASLVFVIGFLMKWAKS